MQMRNTVGARSLPRLSLTALAVVSLFGSASAASLDEIKARGHLTAVTEDDFRPFEFVQDGKPTGFDNELLEKLNERGPIEVRQEIIPFTGLLAGVVSGKYDAAITGLLITKDRQKSLDFTVPIAEATIYYVKRKGDDRIKSVADLNGLSFGIQAGSAMYQRLPELETLLAKTSGKLGKAEQYTSYPEAYQDLALGRTDYVVNNIIGLQTLLREKPDVFEIGEPVSSKTYVAWAVAKGNDTLRAYLDEFLKEQRRNGTIEALQTKWFGTTFPDLPDGFVSEY
ncbi:MULTISPECIES: transporter substrate-binding domain-containing protein [unclassified Aureimonas]|uniref:transporter substrate-binding domain-containing protein n=1 Tax=unclassified Aureimonas TaxID=2615206 RepID=UPI0009EB9E9B|nr:MULTISPECIES: transporter substrate-binding domain-containing protein [unclassified Aureimonas]